MGVVLMGVSVNGGGGGNGGDKGVTQYDVDVRPEVDLHHNCVAKEILVWDIGCSLTRIY